MSLPMSTKAKAVNDKTYADYLDPLLESIAANKRAYWFPAGAEWAFIRLALGKGRSGHPLPTGVREVAEAAIRSGAGEAFANFHRAAAEGILALAKKARRTSANPEAED